MGAVGFVGKKQAQMLHPAEFSCPIQGRQPVSLPVHKAIVPLCGTFGKSALQDFWTKRPLLPRLHPGVSSRPDLCYNEACSLCFTDF
jgi:hypothetical protein